MSAVGESSSHGRHVVVIGGGPSGLMAAETARDAGATVDLYEQMPSVARKFLIAGKGGLNLTHSEPIAPFVARYRERAAEVGDWLRDFGAAQLRAWALGLGYDTVVGSSGRVFPADFKAGPLLRAWVRRIRSKGVAIHCGHRWLGWTDGGRLQLAHGDTGIEVDADAVVLALGGGSWPELGSDGAWVPLLQAAAIEVAHLRPANCGFECAWSAHLIERHSGAPVKSVKLQFGDESIAGEFIVSAYGVEGSAIYALSAPLRAAIERDGCATLNVDLLPDRSLTQLTDALSAARGKRSLSEHLRRHAGLEGVKASLLYECVDRAELADASRLAAAIKTLPIKLLRPRPIAEAISSAGGVRFSALSSDLELQQRSRVWCAGEMIDWEAPTGGYLLTACFASGYRAGRAAAGVPA